MKPGGGAAAEAQPLAAAAGMAVGDDAKEPRVLQVGRGSRVGWGAGEQAVREAMATALPAAAGMAAGQNDKDSRVLQGVKQSGMGCERGGRGNGSSR